MAIANNFCFRGSFFYGKMMMIIGVMLCLYFSFHIVFGYRSFLTLHHLDTEIEKAVANRDIVNQRRILLEKKVIAMRPDSLDLDMVEEQARVILGYRRPDEVMVLSY